MFFSFSFNVVGLLLIYGFKEFPFFVKKKVASHQCSPDDKNETKEGVVFKKGIEIIQYAIKDPDGKFFYKRVGSEINEKEN